MRRGSPFLRTRAAASCPAATPRRTISALLAYWQHAILKAPLLGFRRFCSILSLREKTLQCPAPSPCPWAHLPRAMLARSKRAILP